MIFEPWCGAFPLTRLSAATRGWINSQPLDLLEGYDLLTKQGEQLLFDTLEHHNPYCLIIAFDCRIWSLLTNLNGNIDWDTLRKTYGKRTLKLIVCQIQSNKGRYFLLENPGGAYSWIYEGILMRLVSELKSKFNLACMRKLLDTDVPRKLLCILENFVRQF